MTTTSIRPRETRRLAFSKPDAQSRLLQALDRTHILSWMLILAALAVFSIFAVQTFLVPQTRDYRADWHGAQWIRAQDASAPVAYFRKTIVLPAPPQSAFLTIQGQQFYRLYVDGDLIDDTSNNFRSGTVYDTNVYDVTSFLTAGANTIAVRVDNGGERGAAVRLLVGLVNPGFTQYVPSDPSWRSTTNSALTGQPPVPNGPSYFNTLFVDSAWDTATLATTFPKDGLMPYDPVTFEIALPSLWLSSGPYQDAFLYRTVALPSDSTAWLRIASTGNASVYVNGGQVVGQPPQIAFDQTLTAPPVGVALTVGLYNVTPYLHNGDNSLAIHVAAANSFAGASGAGNQTAAAMVDLLIVRPDSSVTQIGPDASWKASPVSVAGWTTGTSIAQWGQPVLIDQSTFSAHPPYRIPNVQAERVSLSSVVGMSLEVVVLVLLFCAVCIVLQVRRVWARPVSWSQAFDRTALVFAPSVAAAALLFAIGLEPSIAAPFPSTPLWFWLTVLLCPLTAVLLLLPSRPILNGVARRFEGAYLRFGKGSVGSLLTYAVLSASVLFTLFVSLYRLDYEAYWQDELVSLYAAQGVLHYGIPRWVTGVIYTKSEFFSYTLAPVIGLFGTNPYALRGVSVIEHVLTVIVLFYVGRYFLAKLEGLIAATLLAFSAFAVHWAREMRMYQQAQLLVVIVVYLFHKAVQPGARTRYIYLSMLAAVIMYLSHEETYIVLPALVIYLFATQGLGWMRNRHWWIAGLGAVGCILAQLAWWRLTRHPLLGSDRTTRPFIGFFPTNTYFYLRLLFAQFNTQALPQDPYFGVLSVFAILGAIQGFITRNSRLRYLTLLMGVSLAALCVVFSLTSSRYFFPVFPIMLLLAAAALGWILRSAWAAATRTDSASRARVVVAAAGLLLVGAVVFSEMVPLSAHSPGLSDLAQLPYTHQNPDYQRAGSYIRAHWRPGDILIADVPSVDAAFYAVQPAYALYQSKALYVLEDDDHIVESYLGVQMLLNREDFQQVLATGHRIWLYSLSPQCCGPDFGPLIGSQGFQLVFEGQRTYVYLRSG